MFYGREQELTKLEKMYASLTFECAIIYGRRRVGKTTLIAEFCKDKKAIFFSAMESNAGENLSVFSAAIFACIQPDLTAAPVFKSFTEALDFITTLAKNERIILIIDEYPYLASADPSISSLLQASIDHKWKNSQLFLILCGSSMSFMENQVLGYQSPLYGRRTAQFKILPFDYYDTARWVQGYTSEEKAIVYGITGGVPLYIEKIRPDVSLDENIIENIFDKNAFLFEEPANLLKQELREPQTYNAIITAIATGSSKLNEIATKVGIESGLCSKYISSLIALGIVKKDIPLIEKNNKKSIYRIADNLFRFWYRFVPANMAAIVSGRIKTTYKNAVRSHISEFMGLVFEQMCREYLLFHYKTLPLEVGEIGQWWGSKPEKKTQAQIDLVLASPDGKGAIFGECKFKNEAIDVDVLNTLIENASLLTSVTKKVYFLFSKSGFTGRLTTKAQELDVTLVTLDEMFVDGDLMGYGGVA